MKKNEMKWEIWIEEKEDKGGLGQQRKKQRTIYKTKMKRRARGEPRHKYMLITKIST
jgi:hypothetical protein